MNAQRAATSLHQDVKIASSLSRLDHTKGVLPPRHWQIGGVIARDLQEYSCVRATFVRLAS